MILRKFSLEGRAGIVTGGSRGLRKGIATALAQAGADLLIVSRTKSVLEKTAKQIREFWAPCWSGFLGYLDMKRDRYSLVTLGW